MGLTGKQIQKCANIRELAVSKITRACRLVAANFMLQNPDLNKVGGLNKHGKPMTVQIDETFCGRLKHHRGKSKKQTWVLGGVEMPDDTDPPQKRC